MIDTFSIFYFGHNITTDNRNIPFDEGGSELNATLNIGSYTLSEFVVEIKRALDTAGGLTYTVSVDRDTRLITISAGSTFNLLVSSGATVGQSAFSLMGFSGSDKTGNTSYTGSSASGSEYEPQFKLQSFVDSEDFQEASDSSVNASLSGDIEIISFGVNKFFEMDIQYITDLPMDGKTIKNNANGVANARNFLQDITAGRRFEFMKDIDDRDTFSKVILERIPGFRNPTGFRLNELFNRNLRDIFETGVLTLRVIT